MNVPTAIRVHRYASVAVRWLLIGSGVFALTVLAGLSITDEILPKVYTAHTLLILPAGDLVTPSAGLGPEPVAFQPEFENTMLSPEFLLAIVKDLGLEKEWAKRIYKSDQEQLPDVDALTHMEKLVKIEVKPGPNLVEITATSDVPQEAADIANAIARHYQATREMGSPSRENSVRIVARAESPTEPTQPDKNFAFVVTLVVASLLSLTAASFVEMVLLFIRAGERSDS
jgi:capsular polysaccharide biosynthesis protein